MKSETITTGGETYTITYPTTNATLISEAASLNQVIQNSFVDDTLFVKNVYIKNLGEESTPDGGLYVEGATEDAEGVKITLPSDGLWNIEFNVTSNDPNYSMLVKHHTQIHLFEGEINFLEGFGEQTNINWLKSPDGNFPPSVANTWIKVESLDGDAWIQVDVYGFLEGGCDFYGTVSCKKITSNINYYADSLDGVNPAFMELLKTFNITKFIDKSKLGTYKYTGSLVGTKTVAGAVTNPDVVYVGDFEFYLSFKDVDGDIVSETMITPFLTEKFIDSNYLAEGETSPSITASFNQGVTDASYYSYEFEINSNADDTYVEFTDWVLSMNPIIKLN